MLQTNSKIPTDSLFQWCCSSPQVYDWSKNDYVKGGYSYPSLGALRGDRESLAAPVAGTVFFAGDEKEG
jgi:hypothetical protein